MSQSTPSNQDIIKRFARQMRWMNFAIVLFLAASVWFFSGGPNWLFPASQPTEKAVAEPTYEEDSETYAYPYQIDEETGLLLDKHVMLVKGNCLSCHSASIIRNTRATREDWLSLIQWMQKTQGLWDLGENEAPILDYLSKHYGVSSQPTGPFVQVEEWYELD
jgi:nitrate reductase cytochrome c-type subunit